MRRALRDQVERPHPAADDTGALADLRAELAAIALAHGVTRTGVASAEVLEGTRVELHRRRRLGLHDGMQFTFRNPERSTDPTRLVAGARSVFVGARPYLLDDPSQDGAGAVHQQGHGAVAGRVARYAWADHYAPLRAGLWAVAHRLRASGWKAVAVADDNALVDRAVAERAGLGWYGKNANLLMPGAGSWFVLGSVVTTAPLPPAEDPAADGCGTCRRCLDGCPTGAIVEPGVVDAGRCLAWQLQKPGTFPVHLREALGDRIYGCDDCQEVCPPTVHLGHREPSPEAGGGAAVGVESVVDVVAMLDASDDEVIARWGRWYLAGRDPRWLRRNALVVLGNVLADGTGTPAQRARAGAVLDRYARGDDEVLREHARWAASRAGFPTA